MHCAKLLDMWTVVPLNPHFWSTSRPTFYHESILQREMKPEGMWLPHAGAEIWLSA